MLAYGLKDRDLVGLASSNDKDHSTTEAILAHGDQMLHCIPPILSYGLSFPAPISTRSNSGTAPLKPRTKSSSNDCSVMMPPRAQSSLNPFILMYILVIIFGEAIPGKLPSTYSFKAVSNWFAAFRPPCSPCCRNPSLNINPSPSSSTITKGSRSYEGDNR